MSTRRFVILVTQLRIFFIDMLQAGAANAALIFLTFIISIPGMILPTSRIWLKLHGYMVFVCALFTLVLGLSIWFDTLTTRTRLLDVWDNVPSAEQSILQTTVCYSLICRNQNFAWLIIVSLAIAQMLRVLQQHDTNVRYRQFLYLSCRGCYQSRMCRPI